MLVVDARDAIVTGNGQAAKLFGVPRSELEGSALRRFVDAPSIDGDAEQWARRGDGREVAVEVRAGRPDPDDGRRVLAIREVSSRRRDREHALSWLRTVIESCPLGLVLFAGPNGHRVQANGFAIHLFGRPIDPRRGNEQYRFQIRHLDGRAVAIEDLPSNRALRGEAITEGEEYLLRRADGTTSTILVTAAPVLDHDGAIAGAVVAFEDITAIAKLEHLREEWTSIVAHDLRQPLNVISMYAQILRRRSAGDADVSSTAQAIAASAKHLGRMIRDLLDFSRLEASKLTLERRPVSVVAIAGDAVERASVVSGGRPVLLDVRGEMPDVYADPDRLDQILDNLLSNALRYGDPIAEVRVELEGAHDHVAIAVTNRGPGIAPDALPLLFQRFRRNVSHVSKRDSIGLGLYITKGLVEAHGGRIEATSTPGQTTTFRFTLPARKSGGAT